MLTIQEKELVYFGASVASGCKPCTNLHVKKLREAGASDDEIKQAIANALAVRNSAREIMESHSLTLIGIKATRETAPTEYPTNHTTRITELVSTAAAFAINCTSSLEKHIAAARTVGISDDEIRSVLDAALLVKGQAASYVDRIAKLKERISRLQQLLRELEKTQAQLVQSEKMAALGKLVAGVVHEMNTPIGSINSATDVAIRAITNIVEILETGQSIDEIRNSRQLQGSVKALQSNIPVTIAASERITWIVNSLKSFARLDETPFQKVDLHEGLESILTLMEPDFAGRIDVVKDYGDLPAVACYPGELNQVFMNLLTNAVQAIRDQGSIIIRTFAEQDKIHIQITDTGTGIAPQQMRRLFDPGLTKQGARVKAGLGLFTSYNIIQKHRGEIRVESETGKGSTFTIVLPTDLELSQDTP